MNGMNFNIVFAIGQGDSDDDSDDEDDLDGDDGDDEKSDDESTPKKKRKTKKPRIYERIAGDNESTTDEETVTTKSRSKKQKAKSITAGKSSGASVTSSSTKTETKKNKEKQKEQEKEKKPKKKKIVDEVSEDEIMHHILAPTRRKRRIKPKKVSDEKEKEKDNKSEKNSNNDDDDGIDLESAKQMLALLKTQKKKGSDGVLKQFEKIVDKENKKNEEKQKKIDAKEQVKNTREFRKQMRARDEYGNQYSYFKKLSVSQQADLIKELKRIKKHNTIEKPYVIKLLETNIPERYKSIALRKIETLNVMDPGGGEYFKLKQWVDTFMRIPFEKYAKLPVTIEDGVETCSSFMEKAKQTLDDAVFGLDDAKMQIMQMLGQWISNPESLGNAIAIKGPMGTGKTSLVKEGISKIMNRPFAFIPLGGATDSTYLEGHSYTYEGSIWGKIVDTLIQCQSMTPIFYFDELDKVSGTAKGDEIIGILTHLTDTTQNSQFHDKYFSNIDFDLSRALFIFSYNDENLVNPILRDRMYRIQTDGYTAKEKTTIARDYLLPAIRKNLNIRPEDVLINDDILNYIIRTHAKDEKGVRNLKRCLEIIHSKESYQLMKPETKLFKEEEALSVKFPFTISDIVVDKLIKKEDKPFHYHVY